MLAEHWATWAARWEDVDARIPGDPQTQRAARFALFQLWCNVGRHGEAAVGARRLSGPAYSGHVFWDADVFVLPDRGWFAVGLDREKRPIDALTSNMGHCMWTGIIDEEKGVAVAEHLMSPEMFSGWGIRTLATSMGAYNPMSYHNESVWPHDTALCTAGLMRYGCVDQAQRVAEALVDAGRCFSHRMPLFLRIRPR